MAWLAVPMILALPACTSPPETSTTPTSETPSPFDDCAALTAPPSASAGASSPAEATSSAGASSAGGSSSAGAKRAAALPELSLPCFTGGQEVALGALPGPAVINMWASWCGPCRNELPVVQGLAAKAGGRLHVLGVDVGDSREAAASFGRGRSVTMPTLYDPKRRLPAALGQINLPVTVFVDTAGRAYVHPLPMDARTLSELVRTHTGVAVAP
ncbi:TlpA family protein disulfide reductase [Actinoplanes sp. NPDC049265]|uniref:TlpA family protein disulfide reductase n=1 Tax=Actinoplanes sp. NPDC049265 TaxID=3363902 RepID=UPI0037106B89